MIEDMDAPRPHGAHPPLIDLLAFADGDPVDAAAASHIQSCGTCVEQIAGFGEAIRLTDDEEDDDTVVVQLPAIAHLFGSTPDTDPEVDELWHLEWENAAMLAVVTAVASDDRFEVAAAVPVPNDGSIVVPVGLNPLGVALALWQIPDLTVPLGVFARRAGTLPHSAVAEAIAAEPQRSWAASLARLDLVPAVEALQVASWVPEAAPEAAVAPALRELMQARNLRPADVAVATGLSPAEVMDVVRGNRTLTPTEADSLAALLDVAPETIRRPVSLPAALVRAIERPIHRAAIRLRALRDGISEAAVRVAVANHVVAMPARTTTAERDLAAWDQLVRQHLDE